MTKTNKYKASGYSLFKHCSFGVTKKQTLYFKG